MEPAASAKSLSRRIRISLLGYFVVSLGFYFGGLQFVTWAESQANSVQNTLRFVTAPLSMVYLTGILLDDFLDGLLRGAFDRALPAWWIHWGTASLRRIVVATMLWLLVERVLAMQRGTPLLRAAIAVVAADVVTTIALLVIWAIGRAVS